MFRKSGQTDKGTTMPVYRVVFKNKHGVIEHIDYPDIKRLLDSYEQVGVEEDSYTIRLHGEPVLKGLIGPMSEGKDMVRYETPQVFVVMTEQWAKERKNGRKRRSRQ